MAGKAAREFIVDYLFVWFAMAVGTLRYIAVLVLVAGDTGYLTVLAGVLRQYAEYLLMAGTTGARWNIIAVGYSQWLMNRMALETCRECLPFGMRFVTG